MREVKVRFRFDRRTGEAEVIVDDGDRGLPEAVHDRIAAEVGRILSRFPEVEEVTPGASGTVAASPPEGRAPEGEPEPERGPEKLR